MDERDEALLHRAIDGELDAKARAEFEARLAAEPELRALTDEIQQVGALLQKESLAQVEAARFEGFFERITAELAEAPPVLSEADEALIHLAIDGALSADARAEFEARTASNAVLQAATDELQQVGALLYAENQAQVEAASFERFFERVTAEAPVAAAPVIAPKPTPTQITLGTRVTAWWARHWTPVLVSAAAAAAVAFLVLRSTAPMGDGAEIATGTVTVDAVSNDGPGMVLISQPVEDGGVTVIWLLDDEDEEDDAEGSSMNEDPI